ncbi:MAG: hypothetical protein IK015_09155 [Treponema sp.]|nr:hypothetical protein [Treponema sp.]
MCLIMTMIAAAVFGSLFLIQKKKGGDAKALFLAAAMFLAAALMWCVDGIFCVLESEPFFDISVEDTILGAIILVSGTAVFAAYSLLRKFKVVK